MFFLHRFPFSIEVCNLKNKHYSNSHISQIYEATCRSKEMNVFPTQKFRFTFYQFIFFMRCINIGKSGTDFSFTKVSDIFGAFFLFIFCNWSWFIWILLLSTLTDSQANAKKNLILRQNWYLNVEYLQKLCIISCLIASLKFELKWGWFSVLIFLKTRKFWCLDFEDPFRLIFLSISFFPSDRHLGQ